MGAKRAKRGIRTLTPPFRGGMAIRRLVWGCIAVLCAAHLQTHAAPSLALSGDGRGWLSLLPQHTTKASLGRELHRLHRFRV